MVAGKEEFSDFFSEVAPRLQQALVALGGVEATNDAVADAFGHLRVVGAQPRQPGPPEVEHAVRSTSGRPGERRGHRAAAALAAVAVAAGVMLVATSEPEDRVRVDSDPAAQPPSTSAPVVSTESTAPPPPASSEPSPSFAAFVRSQGIAGSPQQTPDGIAIRARTVSGEMFSVVVPADVPGLDVLNVVPDAPVVVRSPSTPRTFLTSLRDEEVAVGTCRELPRCDAPAIERRAALPSGGTYTTWNTGEATVQMGSWTLVLDGGNEEEMERIARSLVWSVEADGYLVLRATDDGVEVRGGGVTLTTSTSGDPSDGVRIGVTPGCRGDLELGVPAVGPAMTRFGTTRPGAPPPVPSEPAYGGRWCASGAYRVEVLTGDPALLERLYGQLSVRPQ